jgi:hypothetical protein
MPFTTTKGLRFLTVVKLTPVVYKNVSLTETLFKNYYNCNLTSAVIQDLVLISGLYAPSYVELNCSYDFVIESKTCKFLWQLHQWNINLKSIFHICIQFSYTMAVYGIPVCPNCTHIWHLKATNLNYSNFAYEAPCVTWDESIFSVVPRCTFKPEGGEGEGVMLLRYTDFPY